MRARWIEGVWVTVFFTMLAAVLYHTPLLGHAAGRMAGLGLRDNNQFVWFFAWPAYAIRHGADLLHPNLIFVPEGYNLARTTPMLTFGVVLVPLTLLAGPIVTYNVVMLAVPTLNGVSAYMLCRRLGCRPPAAGLGGFVFATAGIVSWAELGAPTTGCGAFIALALLLAFDLFSRRSRPVLTGVLLGVDLVAQLYCSAELLAVFLFFGAFTVVTVAVMDPERRIALRSASRALAVAAAILVAGGLPYLVAFAGGGTGFSQANPNLYPNDLLGFIIPTQLLRLGRSYFAGVSGTFIGEPSEAYLGVGIIVIVLWGFVERWRTSKGTRIVGIALAFIVVCSLGTHLTIAGHPTIPMPWYLPAQIPLLRYALPSRFSIFIALIAAATLAVWLTHKPSLHRYLIALASCALLIPNPAVKWSSPKQTPSFFTSGAASRAFRLADRVMVLPFAGPDDQAQALSGFAFSLVGGYLGQYPASYGTYPAATYLIQREAPQGAPAEVARFVQAKHVSAVVVERSAPGPWRKLLSGLRVKPVAREGVLIYRLTR